MTYALGRACGVCAVLGTLLAGASSSAGAQCIIDQAIPGSVPYLLAQRAQATNAKTYGMVGTLETRVLPQLRALKTDDWDQGGGILYWGLDSVYDVTRVPVTNKGSSCDANLLLAPADLNATNLALAYRFHRLTLFYGGGANGMHLVEDQGHRGLVTTVNYILGTYYALGAPAFGSSRLVLGNDDGISAFHTDWLGGATFDADLVEVAAGYVGSKGVYLAVDQTKLRLFARGLVQSVNEVTSLSYFRGGLDPMTWGERGDSIGSTSAFARKRELALPTRDDLAAGAKQTAADRLALWTAHLEHRDIFEIVDLHVAYEWEPEPQLHEVRLGVHTPHYNLVDRAMEMSFVEGLERIQVGGYVGMVQMPRMAYFGFDGGKRLATNLEVVLLDDRMKNGSVLMARLRVVRNDPELLSIFPYAGDAWQIHYSFVMMEGDH